LRPHDDRLAFALLVAAVCWSSALLIAGGVTLVGENGAGVLAALAVPLVVSVIFAFTLRRARQGERRAVWAARGLIGLLAVFALLTGFSIGLFVVPVVAMLVGAWVCRPE